METVVLENDIPVVCTKADSFPAGIPAAYERLANLLPSINGRIFYGISHQAENGSIAYMAAASESVPGEATKLKLEPFIIQKGIYRAITLKDWRRNQVVIPDTFQKLLSFPDIDPNYPCIEWNKGYDEMLCMVKINSIMNITGAIALLKSTLNAYLHAAGIFDVRKFKTKQTDSSWSAAQVSDHLLKSNRFILGIIRGPAARSECKPDAQVHSIRMILLDDSRKLNAREFNIPSSAPADKDELLHTLKETTEELITQAAGNDPEMICTSIELPVLGMMTRLEWLYFAGYHLERHTLQLERIRQTLTEMNVH